jgi:hypothetical protein
VNRGGLSPASEGGASHEFDSRSVICYIMIITFVFWSLVKAKIRMKNRSTLLRLFAVWAFLTDPIMKKDSCLTLTSIVNFSKVSPITELVSYIKPKLKFWVKNTLKNVHSV